MVSLCGGLTAHLLRAVPSAAITLGGYEVVLRLLNAQAKKDDEVIDCRRVVYITLLSVSSMSTT